MEAGLDPRYRVVHISEAPEIGEAEVLAFWAREEAMPEPVARERVGEVVFVAIRDGELVGVSTMYLRHSAQLRCEMWHFRTFVGREDRRSSLALFLLRTTRQHLEREYAAGRDTRAPGLMIEVENPDVRRGRSQAVMEHPASPGVRYPFIGETERGAHIRVCWFSGAEAPPP